MSETLSKGWKDKQLLAHAFEQGKEAHEEGGGLSMNPYVEGGVLDLRAEWKRGWNEVCRNSCFPERKGWHEPVGSSRHDFPGALHVVVEGGDACGKKTQAEALIETLATHARVLEQDMNLPSVLYSFPRYKTPLGEAILRWLKRESQLVLVPSDENHNFSPDLADAMMFQCMMTVDKYSALSEIQHHLECGTHVVCDRWWQSACVYGSTDGLDTDWLYDISRSQDVADLNILLDVPVELAMERRKVPRDRYEEDADRRKRIRDLYLEMWATHDKVHWPVVDGRPPADVVRAHIWNEIVAPLLPEVGLGRLAAEAPP